jgi:acyl phosphate:glycerol-3-phosphate acyltransferase
MYALVCIPLAYLIGSISSTYIISHLSSSFRPKSADDGRISAAAVYRNMGRWPFAITVLMDIGLSASAVVISKILTDSIEIQMAAGVAAVCGHN